MVFWRKKPRAYHEPARLTFTKVMSGQSPLAVAFGYEEERRNNYWHCDQTKKLYRLEGDDFLLVPTMSLAEFRERASQLRREDISGKEETDGETER